MNPSDYDCPYPYGGIDPYGGVATDRKIYQQMNRGEKIVDAIQQLWQAVGAILGLLLLFGGVSYALSEVYIGFFWVVAQVISAFILCISELCSFFA